MRKYKILKPIMLGFLTRQDQFDVIFEPKHEVSLESDGETIWAIKNVVREESITMAHAIHVWLEQGRIAEIPKMVAHHDDPPCTARLNDKGDCPECNCHPDMQSKCLWPYCPSCDCPLKELKCPGCGQTFESLYP